MSNVKVEDLSPAPFFARFLEGQTPSELSSEEARGVNGGGYVTAAYPSDQEGVPGGDLMQRVEELLDEARRYSPIAPPGDGTVVTMAYPSDGDHAEIYDL